uniref:Uncharacterized protein n=1 Tax=mine drainage metagenome TaxID=410659 RepID=E6QPZ7_9ZZZZ
MHINRSVLSKQEQRGQEQRGQVLPFAFLMLGVHKQRGQDGGGKRQDLTLYLFSRYLLS